MRYAVQHGSLLRYSISIFEVYNIQYISIYAFASLPLVVTSLQYEYYHYSFEYVYLLLLFSTVYICVCVCVCVYICKYDVHVKDVIIYIYIIDIQAGRPKKRFLFGHLFFNIIITNVFCAKKRVGHACICPRMVTG